MSSSSFNNPNAQFPKHAAEWTGWHRLEVILSISIASAALATHLCGSSVPRVRLKPSTRHKPLHHLPPVLYINKVSNLLPDPIYKLFQFISVAPNEVSPRATTSSDSRDGLHQDIPCGAVARQEGNGEKRWDVSIHQVTAPYRTSGAHSWK